MSSDQGAAPPDIDLRDGCDGTMSPFEPGAGVSVVPDLRSSLSGLLGAVMDLGQFGPQSSGAILLYDEDSQELQMVARCGKPQHAPCFHGVVKSETRWCGRALLCGEIVQPYSESQEEVTAEVLPACRSLADVSVPLIHFHHRIGVLDLWLGGSVSADNLHFLGLIATYLAAAVDRARASEARVRSDEMMMLVHTGQLITSTLDLDDVLSLIVSETRALLRAEGMWLLLLEETSQELVFAAVSSSDAEYIKGTRIPSQAGIAGWVLEVQHPTLVLDVSTDSRFYAAIDIQRGSLTGSLVSAPISCRGRRIGVIEAVNDTPGSFSSHDMDLLEVLADYAAIAIENARLYEAERELRRVMMESQAQLVHSNRLAAVGRITASLAHELNNPLQALHNSLQVILSFPLEPAEKDTYIKMADEEVTRLMEMVNRILEYSRRPGGEVRPVNLNAVVQRVLDLANKYLEHQHVRLDLRLAPDLPEVSGNPGRLGQVLLNLVINAVEAMPTGGMLRVTTESAGHESVLLRVADTGCGIPPEIIPRLFEPFFTTKKQGTGLGLSISQNIITQYGGSISVVSVPEEGSSFEVRLPVSLGETKSSTTG